MALFVSSTALPKQWLLKCSSPLSRRQAVRRSHVKAVSDLQIQSLKNPRVKEVKMLLRRKQRDKEHKIVLEGQRLISDALHAGASPTQFFYTRDAVEKSQVNATLRDAIVKQGAQPFLIADTVARSFTDTVNPQGLFAVFDKPHIPLPSAASLTLICDEIRDPGNLGTLLRSAAGAGVNAVLLTQGCADVWSLKVLRSGMGAQFRIPTRSAMSWTQIEQYFQSTGTLLRVADGGGSVQYTDVDWSLPCALVVGSEAEGPSEAALALAHEKVAIPLSCGVESLNAAMAGTIILFEAQRQRQRAEQRIS